MNIDSKYPVKFSEITAAYDFYDELSDVYKDAEVFLSSFKWCNKILDSDLYYNLGNTLCVFLFTVDNSQSIEDNRIWVIVGDLPSMYLDVFGEKSIKGLLEVYVELAEDWADKVLSNQSLKGCYPFNAEPTFEIANMLKLRANFILHKLLPHIEDVELKD